MGKTLRHKKWCSFPLCQPFRWCFSAPPATQAGKCSLDNKPKCEGRTGNLTDSEVIFSPSKLCKFRWSLRLSWRELFCFVVFKLKQISTHPSPPSQDCKFYRKDVQRADGVWQHLLWVKSVRRNKNADSTLSEKYQHSKKGRQTDCWDRLLLSNKICGSTGFLFVGWL